MLYEYLIQTFQTSLTKKIHYASCNQMAIKFSSLECYLHNRDKYQIVQWGRSGKRQLQFTYIPLKERVRCYWHCVHIGFLYLGPSSRSAPATDGWIMRKPDAFYYFSLAIVFHFQYFYLVDASHEN